MNDNVYYIGSVLKFLFEITGSGFDQDESDYTVELRCGGVSKTVDGDDIAVSGGSHYLVVNTSEFAPGVLTATVRAEVSDSDLSTTRTEVAVVELGYLREVT